MYLNIGSGPVKMHNALSLDLHITEEVDIVADAREIPRPDESFEGVIASHILEHFQAHEHYSLIMEWRRVIQSKGRICIMVPDLTQCCKFFAENFRGHRDYWWQCIYGACIGKGMQHLSGLNTEMLETLLLNCGFESLRWWSSGLLAFECFDYAPYGTKLDIHHNIVVTGTKGELPKGKFNVPLYEFKGGYKEIE
jgi:predicted SAM-dependent methyltransferase